MVLLTTESSVLLIGDENNTTANSTTIFGDNGDLQSSTTQNLVMYIAIALAIACCLGAALFVAYWKRKSIAKSKFRIRGDVAATSKSRESVYESTQFVLEPTRTSMYSSAPVFDDSKPNMVVYDEPQRQLPVIYDSAMPAK